MDNFNVIAWKDILLARCYVVAGVSAPCRCDCCCTSFDFVKRNLYVVI
jgi:hypothetical protein